MKKEIIKGKWLIYIPEEGDWVIPNTNHKSTKKIAREKYLIAAKRKTLPSNSKIWFRED